MGKRSEKWMVASSRGKYSGVTSSVAWVSVVGLTLGAFASLLWLPGPRSLISGTSSKGEELNMHLDASNIAATDLSAKGVDLLPSLETGPSSVEAPPAAEVEEEVGLSSEDSGDTTVVDSRETTVLDSGETTVLDSRETTVLDSRETTNLDSGETTVLDSRETTNLDSRETTNLDSGETTKLDATSDPPPLTCVDCDITQLEEGPNHTLLGCPSLDHNLDAATLRRISEKKKGPVWLATAGDSLMRSPMINVPRGVMGDAWEKGMRGFNLTWYGLEMAFCCADVSNLETCIFVRCGMDVGEERSDRFVQSFFAEKGSRSFCWTFRFVNVLDTETVATLETYMNHPVPPMMLALNGGLHHIISNRTLETHISLWRTVVETLATINGPREDKTTIFIHSMTHIDDAINKRKGQLPNYNDAHVKLYNAGLDNLLVELGWPALTRAGFRYIDSYSISKAKGVLPVGDGTHYRGSYQTLVPSVQVNLLLHPEYDGFCGASRIHIDQ